MKLRIGCVVVGFLLLVLSLAAQTAGSSPASAQVPPLIQFSNVATDEGGNSLSGVASITFSLYNSQRGGEPLWTETQNNVQLDPTGHYSVQLGITQPNGVPTTLFTTGEARWLGVQIAQQPEQPRVLLLSVPYALKAGDAATIGGLPPSAFVLAAPPTGGSDTASTPAATTTASASPATSTDVTTTGGTINYLPIFSGADTIVDSVLFQSATSPFKIGINTTTPATTLDVKGAATIRGALSLLATGAATATAGANSQPLNLAASTFNSGTSAAVNQTFLWQAEPADNDTATPSGTLNLLFGEGTAAPTETGLSIASNGVITFATGQSFSSNSGTVTSVGSGAGLTGGPITTEGTLSIATGGVTNAMLVNPSVTVTAGTGLTGGGSVALGNSTTLDVNDKVVPLLAAASNTFTGDMTINGILTANHDAFSNTGTGNGISVNNTGTGNGEAITNSSTGVGESIFNVSTGSGMAITNSSTGNGMTLTNSSTSESGGRGISISNSGTGSGITLFTDAIGEGILLDNTGPGDGMFLPNEGTGFGEVITNFSTGDGILLHNTSTGIGMALNNSGTGNGGVGILLTNTGTGFGLDITNSSIGNGMDISNSGTGNLMALSNSSTGNGVYLDNSSTGVGIDINSSGTGINVSQTGGAWGIAVLASENAAKDSTSTYGAAYLQNSTPGSYAAYVVETDTTTADIGLAGITDSAVGGAYGLYGVDVKGSSIAVGGVSQGAGVVGDSAAGLGVVGFSDESQAVTGASADSLNEGIPTAYFANSNPSASALVFKTFGFNAATAGECNIDVKGNLACSGSKSAVVPVEGGSRKVALYAVEGPENWFEDAGSGHLSNGEAVVRLEPVFGQTVNTEMEYHVFLTPNGDCKGLYVAQKSPTSFVVRELGGGTSSIAFDYRIMAKRRGYEDIRLADLTTQFRKPASVGSVNGVDRPENYQAPQVAPPPPPAHRNAPIHHVSNAARPVPPSVHAFTGRKQ